MRSPRDELKERNSSVMFVLGWTFVQPFLVDAGIGR